MTSLGIYVIIVVYKLEEGVFSVIISDKLEVLQEDGQVKLDDRFTFSRQTENCHYNKLTGSGVTNIYNNVKLTTGETGLVIEADEDPNAPMRSVYIGDSIGVAYGSTVKLGVVFLDEGLYVDIQKGFINIGTEGNDFIYESYLDENDAELLNIDKHFLTSFIKHKELFDSLNAVVKNSHQVMETMYELEIAVDYNGMRSIKTISKQDLSNGNIARLEQEKKEAKEEELRKKELRKQMLKAKKTDKQRSELEARSKAMQERFRALGI